MEPRKLAELIVVEKDPLQDLRALRDVRMVLNRETWISHPKVKRLPAVEEQLEKLL